MPLTPAIASRTARSSGFAGSRKRAAMPSSAGSRVIVTTSEALSARPPNSGSNNLPSAAIATDDNDNRPTRVRMECLKDAFMSCTALVVVSWRLFAIHRLVCEIQLFACQLQRFEQLPPRLESFLLTTGLPLLCADNGRKRHGGRKCDRDPASDLRAAARPLAGDTRHQSLLEALFRLDGLQCLSQLLFEVFAHRMSSTIAVPCTRARSRVRDRLRWLFTVLMDISSALAISVGSRSS